jgi:phosphoribosyl 1,2-cyclic phosphodiesterase
MEFRALASSSSGCCYHVAAPGTAPLLLDAGLGFDVIQVALDHQVSKLAGVLLTHAHGDHAKAVKRLMAASINVYASAETWEEMGETGHRAKTIEARTEFPLGGWTILPFEAVHDSPGTLGFVIASPEGKRLLYLTDTGYSKFKFVGLTHIAIECNHSREILAANTMKGVLDKNRHRRTTHNHLSLERLLQMFEANDLSKVEEIVLLHLSDQNSDEEGFRSAVQRKTGIPTQIAPKVLSL